MNETLPRKDGNQVYRKKDFLMHGHKKSSSDKSEELTMLRCYSKL